MAASRPGPEARQSRPSRAAPLHAAAVRAWAEASLAAIGQERAAIDALNVFPVHDGDTGTNMFLTIE